MFRSLTVRDELDLEKASTKNAIRMHDSHEDCM